MTDFLRRTWAEVSVDNIRHNFGVLRDIAKPGVKLVGVIKADAYGHGAEVYAKTLAQCGCDWFAVSNLEEALELRKCGVDTPILILGYTPAQYASVLAFNNISQAVYSLDFARELSAKAVKQGVQVNVHIKIDTGMSRIGFLYQDSVTDEDTITQIVTACKLEGLYPQGVFQHFAVADEAGDGEVYTRLQYELFVDAIARLSREGVNFEVHHCCNSAGTTEYRELQLDTCRVGICLYGLKASDKVGNQDGLKPVLSLKSVVASVRELEEGTTVSYGRTFTATRKTRTAVVPIGYADGYPRVVSGKGARMIVAGQYAPVIGRVCMDMCMLDITDIEGVKVGDTVTVIGKDGDCQVTADELATLAGTINYEITCDISKRVPRVYLDGGEVVKVVNHLK